MSKRISISCKISAETVNQLGTEDAVKLIAEPAISVQAELYEKHRGVKISPISEILLSPYFHDEEEKCDEWQAVRFYERLD